MQMITYFDQKAQLFYAILRKGGRVYMGYSCLSNEEGEPITHKEVMSDPDAYNQLVYKELSEETSASDHSRN